MLDQFKIKTRVKVECLFLNIVHVQVCCVCVYSEQGLS